MLEDSNNKSEVCWRIGDQFLQPLNSVNMVTHTDRSSPTTRYYLHGVSLFIIFSISVIILVLTIFTPISMNDDSLNISFCSS